MLDSWPRRSVRTHLLILVAALALVAAAPKAYAMGQKEDPLAQANAMIQAKQYDQAIAFITDFIQKNPDRFDQAQKLLKKVIQAREEYNKAGQELIDIMKNDPTNEEKKLKIIQKIEGIDPNAGTTSAKFIKDTKTASTFVYNQVQYNAIFSTTRSLLAQGKYNEAATAYAQGFVYYREEFDQGGEDELTKASVVSLVDKIKAEVQYYTDNQVKLANAVEALKLAFGSGDAQAAADAWPEVKAVLEDRATRRDLVVQYGKALIQQFEASKKRDPTITDASYLPFVYGFTLGRYNATDLEGITGTMDVQWVKLLGDLETAFETKLQGEYARGLEAYDKASLLDAAEAFENAAALAETGLALVSLWDKVSPPEAYPSLPKTIFEALQGRPAAYAQDKHLASVAASAARIARNLAQASATRVAAETYNAGLKADSSLASVLTTFASSRASLIELEDRLVQEDRGLQLLKADTKAWADKGVAMDATAKADGDLEAKIGAAKAGILAHETLVASMAYSFEATGLGNELSALKALIATAKDRLNGIPDASTVDPTGKTPTKLLKYPGESAAAFLAQSKGLADLRARMGAYSRKAQGEAPRLVASPEIQAWIAKGRSLQEEAAALEAERVSLLARAQDQKRQADLATKDARDLIKRAESALVAQNFDQADSLKKQADDRYFASFALEENPGLRTEWEATNKAVTGLSARIAQARRDKATVDINRFLRDGKTSYYQEGYAKAEELFIQARALRTTVFNVTDPEVEYWITLAEAALSVNAGTKIASTDPLYAEMSQLISLARTYYTQGQALLNQRKRAEAESVFNLARDKINQVKNVFPQNKEAGLLALRIDQILDPQGFKQQFATKLAAARAQIAKDAQGAKTQIELLESIDPNYPGLQDAKRAAMNAINPPPNPEDQRQARALVAAAKAIVDSGDTGRFQIALAQLTEANNKDATNPQITPLKDRILTFLSTAAQTALSSVAEEQYRQALVEFQNGNYIVANAIIERLLADRANANSQKLKDLSKKIKARL